MKIDLRLRRYKCAKLAFQHHRSIIKQKNFTEPLVIIDYYCQMALEMATRSTL